ncbi:hypothetical protein H8356DRAFT_1332955 [Neocallimastix lanati (nom. inval.)]|nr:hypothetical protein H8356DRAFT_1332955 [Neocallimastix sp. JGI-2020a]
MGKGDKNSVYLPPLIINSEKPFSAYRLVLRQSDLPCIPYLKGTFLRNLLHIDEAYEGVKKDDCGNNIINITF